MEEIKKIISDHININSEDININDNLVTNLQINSFDLITIICELEEYFNIEVTEQEIRNIRTINDIYNFIKEKKWGT